MLICEINVMFKAVIWDMDGVMIDSMQYWVAFDRLNLQEYGLEFNDDLLKLFNGKSEYEVSNWLKENTDTKESVEEIVSKRMSTTKKIYTVQSIEMPGVSLLIAKIKQKNLTQSIASGSNLDRIGIIIDRFGWRPYFDTFFSAENVGFKGKPAPDLYLYTADQLEKDPKDCVVIEDSYNGVLSAKAAGMNCIAVPDERWSVGDFSGADIIADSLEDKKIYKFLGI